MMLFRSAHDTDLDAIFHLAEHCGIGITTLPKDRELLNKRLKWSCTSFKKTIDKPTNEFYLFVLEEPKKGR